MVHQRHTGGKQSVISHESQLSVKEDNQFISLRPRPNAMKMNSALRHSRSVNDLGEHQTYDVKVGYSRRKIPPITQQPTSKAKVVTFYRNGDRYFGGVKISVHSGRYFRTMGNLQDYLTQRIKIPQGVRYIFTLDGQLIEDIAEFQHGESYVASGVKTFQELDYGALARLRTGQTAAPRTNALRPDDLKLLRPISPSTHKEVKADSRTSIMRSSGINSLPGSRESCVVSVINNYDHSINSRVLLNLRTVQAFEDVLEDMGQSVKIKKATRMLTPWGEVVRGFSHMRNDLFEVETFYLDSGEVDSNGNNHVPIISQSQGKKKKTHRVKYQRSNSAPKVNIGLPENLKIREKSEALPSLRVRIQ